MKIIAEFLLTVVLIVILHVLALALSTDVANLLVGVVCFLWARAMVEGTL